MRITLWGINYAPEATGIAPFTTGLGEYLHARGHQVEVLTAFAYYPKWEKAESDRGRLYRTERKNGVCLYRCWHYVPRKASAARRILHEFSFCITSLVRGLFAPRPDVYVVVSPPLGLGFVAWLLSRIKRRPFVFHIQDLQPDGAAGLGMLNQSPLLRALYLLERFAYAKAAAVSAITPGMVRMIREKGVPAGKAWLFPNWIREKKREASPKGQFRSVQGYRSDEFLAVYSGNLGRKQGIDGIIEAARILAAEAEPAESGARVRIIIVGAGAERAALEKRIASLRLPNLRLLPLLSDSDYAAMLNDVDVGLVTQAAGAGHFCFPSKLLSLLNAGVPVVTSADAGSELAQVVADGQFGVNVEPGRPELLAAALKKLADEKALVAQYARATTWVDQFEPSLVLENFERALAGLVAGSPLRRTAVTDGHRADARI